MLKLSPIFGAIIATLITVVYIFIDLNVGVNDLDSVLIIIPFLFFVWLVFSFLFFIPIKHFLLRNIEDSFWDRTVSLFFSSILAIVLSLLIGFIHYYYQGNALKSIFLGFSVFSCLTFSVSFYISISDTLRKEQKNEGNKLGQLE